MISYGYSIFNFNISGDSLEFFYTSKDYAKLLASNGRILRPLLNYIRGYFEYPTLIGILSLLYLSLANYFITDSLSINDNKILFISCGIITTSCSISYMLINYLHDADFYTLSLLLSSIAAWLIVKNKKIFAVPFIVLSLSIYQAYIQTIICIIILLEIKTIIQNNIFNIKSFIKKICTIIFSIIIYYLLYSLVTHFYTNGIGKAYNSVGLAVQNISIYKYIKSFDYFLSSYINYFFNPNSHNIVFIRYINIIYMLITITIVIRLLIKNRINILNVFIIVFLVTCLFFAINFQTILIGHYHILIIFSFCLLYLFAFMIEDVSNHNNKTFKYILIVISLLLIWDNIIYSNEISLKKELDANETLSTYTRLISDIEDIDGYEIGKTPIALLGNINDSPISQNRDGFNYNYFTNASNFSVLNDFNQESYLSKFLNYPIVFVDNNKKNEIVSSDLYKSMPCYPNKGSILLDNGIVIVKLSSK